MLASLKEEGQEGYFSASITTAISSKQIEVRNANVVAGSDVAGFFDHAEYEEAKKAGKEGIGG
jgi:hypothetical protein